MKARFDINKLDPDAYKAMDGLEDYVANSGIEPLHQELIRIRASQINGCSYCVDMHSGDARKAGASDQWVYLVSAWREAGTIFTDEERLVLKMTEEVTLIHLDGFTDATYENAINTFGEEKTARVIMVILTINAWNRIGVATKMHPSKKQNLQTVFE